MTEAKSAHPDRAVKIILLSFAAFAVSLIILFTGLTDTFELKSYDLFSQRLNPARPLKDDIVIIQVDQRSIDAFNGEGIQWPWPRQMYAPLIEYLSEADAVFVDILFTEPSSYGQGDDAMLSQAFIKSGNVYLPLFLTGQARAMNPVDDAFIRRVSIGENAKPALSFSSAIPPTDLFKGSVRGAGNVMISPGRDGVYRSIPLLFGLRDQVIPHFVLSHLLRKGTVQIVQGNLFSGGRAIPLTEGGLLLRYYSDPAPFPVFSAVDIVKSAISTDDTRAYGVRKEFFRNKTVFVGLTAAGLFDLKPTPVSPVSNGVMIHATTLDNLMAGNFMRTVPRGMTLVAMLLASFLITTAVLRFHSLTLNLALFLLSLCFGFLVPAVVFKGGFSMDILSLPLSLVTGYIIAAGYSYATEGRERRFIRKTFSQYMDATLVDYVLKNPELIRPGGQRRHVTVFFADIAGFTSISEQSSPEETARILHTVLNTLTEIVIEEKGVVDKYIGDCIMAFWGAPEDTDADETNACRAALRCREALRGINERFASEGLPSIAMRIGIHSGNAIVGNMGSDRLFDYTVIGDTVNLASRLESVNKLFRTEIIISEETMKSTGDVFAVRDLGLIEVKGKSVAVRIYELAGERGCISSGKEECMRLFQQARELYQKRQWDRASGVFQKVMDVCPGDGPADFYKKRCETFMKETVLPAECDIIKMTEK